MLKADTQSSKDFITYDIMLDIFKNVPCFMYFKDRECKYRIVSQQAENYNYLTLGDDSIGKNDMEVFGEERGRKYYETDLEIIREKKNISFITALNKNGDEVYLNIRKQPVLDDLGEVIGIVGIAVDVTEIYAKQREIERAARIDSLTGLYNRNYYEEYKDEVICKENLPISVIMGDADGLKFINDGRGHIMGDGLLKQSALMLKQAVDKDGLVFRYGGDEFVAICKNTDYKKCSEIIEKIRKQERMISTKEFPISISLGGATANDINTSINSLIREAECKMYREKTVKKESFVGKWSR